MKYIAIVAALMLSGCASQLNNLEAIALGDAQHASMLAAEADDPVAQNCYDRIAAIADLIQKSHEGAQGILVKLEIARIISRDKALPDCRAFLSGFSIQF